MKSLFEQMSGTYSRVGDYLIPDLVLPAEKESHPLGKYGMMHLNFIKKNKRVLYINLLTSGELSRYLQGLDKRATKKVEQIVGALAKVDGTDENLKAQNQMRWVWLMNNYRHCAEEIVFQEVVFA